MPPPLSFPLCRDQAMCCAAGGVSGAVAPLPRPQPRRGHSGGGKKRGGKFFLIWDVFLAAKNGGKLTRYGEYLLGGIVEPTRIIYHSSSPDWLIL